MAKKTPKQLDADIDAYLRGERVGPRELAPAPVFDQKLGAWVGGDKRTLYAFPITWPDGSERVVVAPGAGTRGKAGIIKGVGGGTRKPRIATYAEAEEHWQKPLHAAWNVRP